jgi:hypothetical protein
MVTDIEKLKNPDEHRDDLCSLLNDLIVKRAIDKVNEYFAYKRLAKLNREEEPLPTDPRQLSSYRTRLGTMLEYGISTEIQFILEEMFGDEFNLTFAVAHEYPDFYLRDKNLNKILKIELKAVDADSDEQAARFDVLTKDIDTNRDFILFMGWQWVTESFPSGEEWEHPRIFSFILLPAIEIANERDRRLLDIGGKIEGEHIMVPSTKKPGTFVKDPGNYGKFWRIVQPKRRKSSDLTDHIRKFLNFQKEVDKRAPRTRFRE